jgi:hypothetical protein
VEGSVKLNQIIAPIAKQMFYAERAKGFSPWLLEDGNCQFPLERAGSLSDLCLRQKSAKRFLYTSPSIS